MTAPYDIGLLQVALDLQYAKPAPDPAALCNATDLVLRKAERMTHMVAPREIFPPGESPQEKLDAHHAEMEMQATFAGTQLERLADMAHDVKKFGLKNR
jgi:hypothetical protein